MKIVLNTASCDNSGRFVDAGAEVSVGDGKTAIASGRAQELVDRGMASEVKAQTKAAAKSDDKA